MIAAALAVEIAVLTMTPGALVFERFGHTALRVDEGGGRVRVFNFGAFNSRDPELPRKFLEARLEYWVAVTDWDRIVVRYADRVITGQVLRFTDAESARLLEQLEWTILPEHRAYRAVLAPSTHST